MRHLVLKKKCVDNVLGLARTLVQLFYDAAGFLTETAQHGIIQNVKKFKWGRREIEFVGFWLKEDGLLPSKETLAAIKNFPRPVDITGIRSFDWLVVLVSYTFAKSEQMNPFRSLPDEHVVCLGPRASFGL